MSVLDVFAQQGGASASCIDSKNLKEGKLRLKAENAKHPGLELWRCTHKSVRADLAFPNCLELLRVAVGREQNFTRQHE